MEYAERMKEIKSSSIREILKFTFQPGVISFAAGSPSPLTFPVEEFGEISREIFASRAQEALQYNITEGYPPLVDKIVQYNKKRFDMGRDFDRTLIVTGAQQGLDFFAKVFINEGDVVICENPSFVGGMNAFKSYGARMIGVDLEEDGIDVNRVEEILRTEKKVKAIYLIPTFQNPSGITMSAKKRKEIYALAKKHQVLIVEDNPYGELRYRGEDILPIKAFDEEGLVVYVGTFSKTLSAGMRLGFVVAQEELFSKMVLAKQVSDVHTPIYFQILVDEYLSRYDYSAHIKNLQGFYAEKCDAMLTALDTYIGDRMQYTRPEGGLFIWCTLPDAIDLDAFTRRAMQEKIAFVPGYDFMAGSTDTCHELRLNFSIPTEEQIETGIKTLGTILKEMNQ